MSLQNDFELCLEYAEKLEAKQEQRVQAQNNIIFMKNESERLKNKLRICKVLSALGLSIFVLIIIISFPVAVLITYLPCLLISAVVFIVSFFNCIKTKKESNEFESQKPRLIQQYTTNVEECEHEINSLIKKIYQEGLFDIVPADYFYTSAIEFCITQVRKKLANTATEAFQQLDIEIKRLEQMEYLEQMNNAHMEQLNDIKRAIYINTLINLAQQDKKES